MLINFTPMTKKYGSDALKMPDIIVDISTAKQLIECIRDGYEPTICWPDTKDFLYEMMYNEIDNNSRHRYNKCVGIIDAIGNYYFSTRDFRESDAIMVFKRFLESGILNFQVMS